MYISEATTEAKKKKNGDLNVHNSRWAKHKKKELCRSRPRTASHVKARKREGGKKRAKEERRARQDETALQKKKKRFFFFDLRISGAIKRETKNVSAKREKQKEKTHTLHFIFFS